MVTKKDVELAARIPQAQAKIKEIQDGLLKRHMEEEERRLRWSEEYYKGQGALRAAQDELQAAAEADARIYMEVPADVRVALEAAKCEVRGSGEGIARARMLWMAAQETYDKRLKQSRSPGEVALTKAMVESFVDDINVKRAALKELEDARKALEAKVAKLKAEADKVVAAAKKAAR